VTVLAAQNLHRRLLVAPLLDEDLEDLALLVDGPPHEHAFALFAHHHLIEVPHEVCMFAPAAIWDI